jgi:hypothetical protein
MEPHGMILPGEIQAPLHNMVFGMEVVTDIYIPDQITGVVLTLELVVIHVCI